MRGFASLFGRRGVLAAAFAAVTVLVVAAALQFLTLGASWIYVASQQPGMFDLANSAALGSLVLGVLPFSIGVFLSLWLLGRVDQMIAGALRDD